MILLDDILQFIFAVSLNLRLSLEAQCACQVVEHVMDQENITRQHMLEHDLLSDLSVDDIHESCICGYTSFYTSISNV